MPTLPQPGFNHKTWLVVEVDGRYQWTEVYVTEHTVDVTRRSMALKSKIKADMSPLHFIGPGPDDPILEEIDIS